MLDRYSDRIGDLIVGTVSAFIIVVWTGLSAAFRERDEFGMSESLAWIVLLTACAALFFRSSFPLTVTLITWACTTVYYVASAVDGPMLLTFIIALYTLAASGRTIPAMVIGVLTFLLVLISEILAGFEHMTESETLMISGWIIAIVAIGMVVAHYRRYRTEVGASLTEGQRRSVAEERLRIARELHDAVGHHLSLINVQTAAALRKVRRNPSYSTEATLKVIADTSQLSLRELRAMVGVLREAGQDSPTGPGPSLEQLPSLVEAARAAGLEVAQRTDGSTVLPVAVDAAAFRVAQEAVTNVVRHAEAQRVWINVVIGTTTLAVSVADDGNGNAKASKLIAGNGLTGMRERAESLGGTFNAGPRAGGGFIVEATWPLEERE